MSIVTALIVSTVVARVRMKRDMLRSGETVAWHDLRLKPYEGTFIIMDHDGLVGRQLWWTPGQEGDDVMAKNWIVVDMPFYFVSAKRITGAIPGARVEAFTHVIW